MAKKKKNSGVKNKNKNKNNDTNNDGGEKEEDGSIASKIVKWVKSFQSIQPQFKKNKLDRVSPQPKKDNEVNKDDANYTKKKQPKKTNNDEKPKEAPLRTVVSEGNFHEKRKEEDEGIYGGKSSMAYRHAYGYQTTRLVCSSHAAPKRLSLLSVVFGVLVFGLLVLLVFGLLVMYKFHLAKDIYTYVTLLTHRLLYI